MTASSTSPAETAAAGNDPQANSQDLNSLLGKILRINVSGATGYIAAGGYPGALPEVYAVGLRNPWRMSLDPVTGNIWIGDVGQGAREEIDILMPSQTNRNYGWVCWEGSFDNRGVPSAANSNCQAYSAYVAPVFEYPRSEGQSVTGGLVYRGSMYPALQGFYVLADYASDKLWAIRGTGASQEVYGYPGIGSNIVGFGTAESGEAFAVGIFGTVYSVISTAPLPVNLTDFAVASDGCALDYSWASADERNFSHFVLEQSVDGRVWQSVLPKGASSERIAARNAEGGANYLSSSAAPASQGYARLKMVDLDGSFTYSDVVRWQTACAKTWRVGPNPVRVGSELALADLPAAARVLVTDATGRTLLDTHTRGAEGDNLSLSTRDWAPGIYTLRIGDDVERVVVQ